VRRSARAHLCGIQSVWTEQTEAAAAIAEVAGALAPGPLGQLILFFSPEYDAAVLCGALATWFPGVPVAGCTTSGGICPAGAIERGLVMLAFPAEGFRMASTCLPNIGHFDVESAATTIRTLRRDLDQDCIDHAPGQRFALTLIDGLTNVEETVVSTIAWSLDGIPLVGGSAGDDLRFRDTVMIFNGVIMHNAAIVLIVETDFPVQIFKTDNFEPTTKKFVVTSSDDEHRIVYEFNAEPAAREYAMAVGIDPESLNPMSFAAHPLVVKVGGEYFCRSIRHLNADGSLGFFCAVGEGVVMTLAQPRDIVEATRQELARLDDMLGGLDIVIGFDCVLRRLDAEVRQVRREISDLYRRYNVVGFETYGEQYRSMHLNQTFTGIAIGHAPRP
jgi:hypothetical protein